MCRGDTHVSEKGSSVETLEPMLSPGSSRATGGHAGGPACLQTAYTILCTICLESNSPCSLCSLLFYVSLQKRSFRCRHFTMNVLRNRNNDSFTTHVHRTIRSSFFGVRKDQCSPVFQAQCFIVFLRPMVYVHRWDLHFMIIFHRSMRVRLVLVGPCSSRGRRL